MKLAWPHRGVNVEWILNQFHLLLVAEQVFVAYGRHRGGDGLRLSVATLVGSRVDPENRMVFAMLLLCNATPGAERQGSGARGSVAIIFDNVRDGTAERRTLRTDGVVEEVYT